jgi:hypothetical protein
MVTPKGCARVLTWVLLPLPIAILVNRKGVLDMNIAFFAKGTATGAVGYSARGVGFSLEKVGAGIEIIGRKTKEGGIALGAWGKKQTDMSSLYFKASSSNGDATQFTDGELKNLGYSDKEVSEIRASYQKAETNENPAPTPAPAETKAEAKTEAKSESAETVEVTPEQAAAMLV